MKSPFSFRLFFLFLLAVITFGCDNDDECAPPPSNDYLTFTYANPDGNPVFGTNAVQSSGNLTFESTRAIATPNGISLFVSGVRIRSQQFNFELTGLQVEEKRGSQGCFQRQTEFGNNATSFQTDIAVALVLDMSTSLLGNVEALKGYAKEFASTVVTSSANSTVAVVFFSSRNTIETTDFYRAGNIATLHNLIDNYDNYQDRTALFQAASVGLGLLENLDFGGEKSLVVFTDGGDNDSNNPGQLQAQIESSPITRFSIGLDGSDFRIDNLRSIASRQGYTVVASDINNLQSVFRAVVRGVISVYELEYRRSDQLLSFDEEVQIRFSVLSEQIE